MAEIFNFYVHDNRSIQFPKANLLEPIMQEDHNVAIWRFRIPKVLNDIDMSAWAWWFVYVNARGQEFSELLTLVDDIDEPDSFCTADFSIDYGISKNPGEFTFALEADNVDGGGEILNKWHTKTYKHKVDKTLQGNHAEFAETESDIISALIVEVQNKVRQLVGGATPEPVSLIADMTDTSKVYLYVGEETGESTNYWYYHNGSAWVAGGLYASGIQVDSAPTQGSTNAVQSGGVWSALDGLQAEIPTVDPTPTQGSNNAVRSGGVYEALSGIQEDVNLVVTTRYSQYAEANIVSGNDTYWKIDASGNQLVAGTQYKVVILSNVDVSLNDIKIGTSTSLSTMVDTIATNVSLVAGEPFETFYIPSQDGLAYLRFLTASTKIDSVVFYVGGKGIVDIPTIYYDREQNLTDAQKQQAQRNLGFAGYSVLEAQVSQNTDDIAEIGEKTEIELNTVTWTIGTISTSSGGDNSSTTRLRSGYIAMPNADVEVKVTGSYGVRVFGYETTAYTSFTGMIADQTTTDTITIPAGTANYIRIVIWNIPSADFADTTASENVSVTYTIFAINGKVATNIADIAGLKASRLNIQKSVAEGKFIEALTFETGYITASGDIHAQTATKEVFTNKIEVYEGENLEYQLDFSQVRTMWLCICTYTAQGQFIERIVTVNSSNRQTYTGTFVVGTGIGYVAFTFRGYEDYTFSCKNPIESAGGSNVIVGAEWLTNTLIKSVNHRGYNSVAPENTLPAYVLSKKHGFRYVETDVSFTSDNVPVLLHDASIDRCSDGTGLIYDMTYADVLQYDFGSWKSASYAGTKIASFDDFMALCRGLGLHPYIELKVSTHFTQAQIESLVPIVKKYGMLRNVTWISFSADYLGYISNIDPYTRLGYLSNAFTSAELTVCDSLKTATNEVFMDAKKTELTDAVMQTFIDADIPVEAWTVDAESELLTLNPYISGFTSNLLVSGDVICRSMIGD